MNFKLTSTIARPRQHVYELLANPNDWKQWLPQIVGYEPLAGMAGTPGATARLTFDSAGRTFGFIETIIDRKPPNLLASTYEYETVIYSLFHQLESVSEAETRWICEFSSDVQRGGWLVNWLMSRAVRAGGAKAMAKFKAKAEGRS